MVQNEKVQNGSKLPKLIQHGPEWFRMIGNVGGWPRMVQNGSEGPGWFRMIQNRRGKDLK